MKTAGRKKEKKEKKSNPNRLHFFAEKESYRHERGVHLDLMFLRALFFHDD